GELLIGSLTATSAKGTRVERVDAVLGAYFEVIASQPSYARILLVEVNAAGPEALRRRSALQRRFTDALIGILETEDPEARFAIELAVAGIGWMVTMYLIDEDLEGLRGLREPLVALVRRLLDS